MLRDIAILWDVMEFQDGRRGQTDGPRAKGIQFRLLIAFYALVLVLLHLYPRYRFGNTSISKRRMLVTMSARRFDHYYRYLPLSFRTRIN